MTQRVALVTGASRNIGRAIAVRLAEGGFDVVVHVASDRQAGEETAEAVRKTGRQAHVVRANLAEPDACRQLVKDAISSFGRLDVLVNNAAVRPEAAFEDIDFEEWRQVMAVALDAPFLVSQAAIPELARSDRAAIVNIGGLTGQTGASHRAHVVTAKAGLVGLTKAMAHDLAERGITVNCVVPGLIQTARAAAAGDPVHHSSRTNLVGRRGTAEEVAAAVGYLVSADGRYTTGQSLHVNGGAFLP